MVTFAILEAEEGYTIVELQPGEQVEEVAVGRGAVVADPGPFSTLEEAQDALDELQGEEEEELEGGV